LFPEDNLCNIYGDCIGLYLEQVISKNEKDCQKQCENNPGQDTNFDGEIDGFCNWYSFHNVDGYNCHLFITCDRIDDTVDYISGNVKCNL